MTDYYGLKNLDNLQVCLISKLKCQDISNFKDASNALETTEISSMLMGLACPNLHLPAPPSYPGTLF